MDTRSVMTPEELRALGVEVPPDRREATVRLSGCEGPDGPRSITVRCAPWLAERFARWLAAASERNGWGGSVATRVSDPPRR